MKKILYSMCLAGAMLTSCTDWLDITPENTVIEQDLFKEASGFQNALNGVYESMSANALYGTELTFGLVDVLGQVYALKGVNGEYYAGIQSYHYYFQAGQFQYDANEDVKGAIGGIWENGYKAIANCNNIIKNIENLPAEKFMYGELERNMIKGEALAARALLYFDILRLFAPSLKADDGKLYIPYVTDFPYYGGQTALSVQATMEKIEADLLQAKDLVMAYDTSDLIHRYLLASNMRFTPAQSIGSMEDGSEIAMNPFYFFRGYRLSGMAVEAMLARMYSWWGGDKMKLAATHAKNVTEFTVTADSLLALGYTSKNLDYDRKFTNDLIFCLSAPKLQEDYKGTYGASTSNSYLVLGQFKNVWNYDLADGGDYRLKLIQQTKWDGNMPLKNIRPDGDKDVIKHTEDMVPMIRLSEMHLIQAEYYASIGDFTNAAKMITEVRVGRNCKGDVDLGIRDMETFKSRLLGEVRREFFQEGQTFYFYKKYGEPLVKNMTPDSFVIPKPESENIN